jgi:hypothetical protein
MMMLALGMMLAATAARGSEGEVEQAVTGLGSPWTMMMQADDDPCGRPAMRMDTIGYEGQHCNVMMRLIGQGFPFCTYLPRQVVEKQTTTGDGTSVWFFAAFHGEVDPDAYLHFYFPSEPKTIAEMQAFVASDTGLARNVGWNIAPISSSAPWIAAAYRILDVGNNGLAYGHIYVATCDGQPFLMTLHYTQETAAAFLPCVSRILDELRWKESGKGLAPRTELGEEMARIYADASGSMGR